MKRLDDECRRELLDAAMNEVRSRVQTSTFESWRLMSFEGCSGEEVAQTLGINVGTVFVARSRVDRLMSEIVRRLDREPASDE
jgi:RNA polymerase sigma-70 factor (ECF subfamily)